MATTKKNLLACNMHDIPNAKGLKFTIIVSKWNNEITDRLLDGAIDTLVKSGVRKKDIFILDVPGSFELLYAAKTIMHNGYEKDYYNTRLELIDGYPEYPEAVNAIICLGSVIKGETKHFDFICNSVTNGIKDLNLSINKEGYPFPPIIFGVLTDDTYEQAINRSGGKYGNKGSEAAITAICMSKLKIRCI